MGKGYVFHPLNAYVDGDLVVCDVGRHAWMSMEPEVYTPPAFLHRWTFDLASGAVSEERIDERTHAFSRVDDRVVGLPHRYGWGVSHRDGSETTLREPGVVVKWDVVTGTQATYDLGPDAFPSEFVFVQDRRVRQALALAFNFEWTNESLQYGLFKQRASYTQDTPLMANGLPEGAELEFLQSLGDLVPPEMMTEPALVPHESSPDRLLDRRNARAAMRLLDDAGWAVGDDGIRRNAAGQTLKLNFLFNSATSPTLSAVMENYVANVKTLGVDITFEKVDSAQYTTRERDRDYDLVFDGYAAFLGTGTGLMQRYGSEAAAFSLFNPAGLASPLVDAIIDRSLNATTREEEQASLMALDRALRYEFIMIPVWYNPSHWVAYYDQYEHPEEIPAFALGQLDFWWYNDEKADALRAAGALR